jgi:hypothetical protein
MRRRFTFLGLAASTAIAVAAAAGMPVQASAQSTERQIRVVQPVAFCWHGAGWNGPGWYRCGSAQLYGYGWGGPRGWQGWPVPVARATAPPRRFVRVYQAAPVCGYEPASPYGIFGRFAPPVF